MHKIGSAFEKDQFSLLKFFITDHPQDRPAYEGKMFFVFSINY